MDPRFEKLFHDLARLDSQYRFDVAESAFLERELETVRAETYEVQYAEFKWRQFVPTKPEDNGAEVHKYNVSDKVGEAGFISNYADDLKRADVFETEVFQVIKSIGASYGWNIQELRAAARMGKPLSSQKAAAARFVVEKLLDDIMLEGNSAKGLSGLFSLSNTLSHTIANGAGGTKLWADKTPDEIKEDLHAISRAIHDNSKEIERPDTIILPTSRHGMIADMKMGDGDNRSVLQAFLDMDEHVRAVEKSYRLETLGAGSTARMVCYTRRQDKVYGVMAQEFEQFAPQLKNLEVLTNTHARTGGVVSPFPKSVAYGDAF